MKTVLKLSIIIPVYNEVHTLNVIIDAVKRTPLSIDKEIIIVDDCSNDGTTDLLKRMQVGDGLKVYYHTQNQGKGAALNTGFRNATGDILIIQDADLEYDPMEYNNIISPILNNKADVVYGSRFIGSGPHRVLYFWHYLGNKFLTTLSNMFTNLNLTDMETCYKAFRREVIDKISIEENRFGFEPEITAKISHLRCRIYEVGIAYEGRTYEEGKKIGWKDGVSALRCIIKYNLRRRGKR